MPGCSLCKALNDDHLPSRYVPVHDFGGSLAVLAPSQYYPGRCELWHRRHATELFQLSAEERRRFMDDIAVLAAAIFQALQPQKLNYEVLGNTVPHLHCHIIPRYRWDRLPKRPIWEDLQFKAVERRSSISRPKKLQLASQISEAIEAIMARGESNWEPYEHQA